MHREIIDIKNDFEYRPLNKRMCFLFILYVVVIYYITVQIHRNHCVDTFPPVLSKVVLYISDNFLTFLEKHRYYTPSLDCFKKILTSGALIALPLTGVIFFIEYQFLIEKAKANIQNRRLLHLFIIAATGIIAPIFCLYLDAQPNSYRSITRGLFFDLSKFTVQANRTIVTMLSLIIMFLEISSYFIAALQLRKKKRRDKHVA